MDLFTIVCCVVAILSALAWVGTKVAKLPLELKLLKSEIGLLELQNSKNKNSSAANCTRGSVQQTELSTNALVAQVSGWEKKHSWGGNKLPLVQYNF